MVPQNIAEGPLNITNILNIFKSFYKQVYQKHRKRNIKKKKDQNNYFRAEISKESNNYLDLK